MVVLTVVALGVLGLCIGSFVNVVVHRWPHGMSLVRPPSHCPRCKHPVRARHNVPVLGWLALRGRCFDCAAPISARYPAVELGLGVVYAGTAWLLAARHAYDAIPVALTGLTVLAVVVLLEPAQRSDRIVPVTPVLASSEATHHEEPVT